jgi:hypothetical protein
VYFSRFGMLYQEKSGNPDSNSTALNARLRYRMQTLQVRNFNCFNCVRWK